MCASDEKPVPKSSSASRMPWFFRLVTIDARHIHVGEQRAFGDFDDQSLGGKTGLRKDSHDPLRKPAVRELRRGDVDRNLDRGVPLRRFAKRVGNDLLGKAADQADFLRDGDEDVGTDHARKRVVPPREHLETDDLAVGKIDLRLEIGNELAVIEAEANALLDLAVGDERALHPLVEPDRAAAPGRCAHGPSRCRRGAARPECGRRGRRRSNAGKSADLDDPLVEHQRLSHGAQDRLGKLFGAIGLARPAIASATANSSPLMRAITASAPARRKRGRDRLQKPFPGFIAMLVVDRLEAVDLEGDDDEIVAARAGLLAELRSRGRRNPCDCRGPSPDRWWREPSPASPARRELRLRAGGRRSGASRTGSARR